MRPVITSITVLLLCFFEPQNSLGLALSSYKNPIKEWKKEVSLGWKSRVAADPNFAFKSVAEVVLAAGTQFAAEWHKRGDSLLPEIDFVVAGVLTAMSGKYYSMWKVAMTKSDTADQPSRGSLSSSAQRREPRVFNMTVPTNAFQRTMPDGITRPTVQQRFGSILAPMGDLFRAGIITSLVGYGLTALMIQLRTILVPTYVAATRNVNIIYASIFNGVFLAVVSNLRYQILQGLIEPCVEFYLRKLPFLRDVLFFVMRTANGLLGSWISITGMKCLGLQRLK